MIQNKERSQKTAIQPPPLPHPATLPPTATKSGIGQTNALKAAVSSASGISCYKNSPKEP